jgi:hypothetical protein
MLLVGKVKFQIFHSLEFKVFLISSFIRIITMLRCVSPCAEFLFLQRYFVKSLVL